MKTEKEIKESIQWLNDRINESLNASELGEDIVGEGTELPRDVFTIYISKRQALEWVLDDGEHEI